MPNFEQNTNPNNSLEATKEALLRGDIETALGGIWDWTKETVKNIEEVDNSLIEDGKFEEIQSLCDRCAQLPGWDVLAWFFNDNIVASKSQKKYTIIVSAEDETEAKEKLHKDGYSLLSISIAGDKEIEGNKFLFQIEKEGEIKNGIIIGKDIFKVYKKLKDDLWYHILFLYPEGDEAETNAEKKQLIINQLEVGYKLQKQKNSMKNTEKSKDETFYIRKELEETYALIEKVMLKIEDVIEDASFYNIPEEKLLKIEAVYSKLKQIKKTTNIAKLREIWEKALIKIWEVESELIEWKKWEETSLLLKDTNALLKKIGSDKSFKKKKEEWSELGIQSFFSDLKESILFFSKKEEVVEKTNTIDKESYNFLKTVLLLEKYKEKLRINSKEIHKNLFLFINVFSKSSAREKMLIKRKVIKQNIALLKAKKNGSMSSYTWIKKWYRKAIEWGMILWGYISNTILLFSLVYVGIFFITLLLNNFWLSFIHINSQSISVFIFSFILYICFSQIRNFFVFSSSIAFFFFFYIFIGVNF